MVLMFSTLPRIVRESALPSYATSCSRSNVTCATLVIELASRNDVTDFFQILVDRLHFAQNRAALRFNRVRRIETAQAQESLVLLRS